MPTDTTTDDATRLIENVRMFEHDLESCGNNIKTLKEQLRDMTERLPEHDAVQQLADQLKQARERLKYALLNTPGYNDLMEKLADEKDSKRSAELDLSDYLIAYHAETKERQIELGQGDAREVILKGRLGKPKDFQTSLLSGGTE